MRLLLNTVVITRDVLSLALPMAVMLYMTTSQALDAALPPTVLGFLTVVVVVGVFIGFRLATNGVIRRLGAVYRAYEWKDR